MLVPSRFQCDDTRRGCLRTRVKAVWQQLQLQCLFLEISYAVWPSALRTTFLRFLVGHAAVAVIIGSGAIEELAPRLLQILFLILFTSRFRHTGFGLRPAVLCNCLPRTENFIFCDGLKPATRR